MSSSVWSSDDKEWEDDDSYNEAKVDNGSSDGGYKLKKLQPSIYDISPADSTNLSLTAPTHTTSSAPSQSSAADPSTTAYELDVRSYPVAYCRVLADRTTVKYIGRAIHTYDVGSVRALPQSLLQHTTKDDSTAAEHSAYQHSTPHHITYYEVTVTTPPSLHRSSSADSTDSTDYSDEYGDKLVIGYAPLDFPLHTTVGGNPQHLSYGLQTTSLHLQALDHTGQPPNRSRVGSASRSGSAGEEVKEGDRALKAGEVYGAGYNSSSAEVFYTHNGKLLPVKQHTNVSPSAAAANSKRRDTDTTTRPPAAVNTTPTTPPHIYPTISLHSPNLTVSINLNGYTDHSFVFDVHGYIEQQKQHVRSAVNNVQVAHSTQVALVRDYLLYAGYVDTLQAFDRAYTTSSNGSSSAANNSHNGASDNGSEMKVDHPMTAAIAARGHISNGTSSPARSASSNNHRSSQQTLYTSDHLNQLQSTLPQRYQLIQLIQQGHIDDALQQLEFLLPEVADSATDIWFYLQCSQFMQYVCSGDTTSGVRHLQSVVRQQMQTNANHQLTADQQAYVYHLMSLLVQPTAGDTPTPDSTYYRDIASHVNDALITHLLHGQADNHLRTVLQQHNATQLAMEHV